MVAISTAALGAVDSEDLNWEGAKAKYDAQRAISDRAYARWTDYQSVFNDIQSRYLGAVGRLRTAETEVTNLRGEVDRIETDLRNNEDEIPRQQTLRTRLVGERQQLQTNFDRAQRDVEQAQRNVRQETQQLRQAEKELADEKKKPKPDANRVKQLEQRVATQQRELNEAEQRLRTAQNNVNEAQTHVRNKDEEIAKVDRKMEELRTMITRLNRERDSARDRLSDARVAVERVRGEVSNLSGQVDSARTELGLRESEYRREYSVTQSLLNDYNAVVANYNREKDRVLRAAADAAGVDGYREGLERGNPDGADAGQKNAVQTATAAGTQQAKARDKARGYRDGREKGKADGTLAGAYGAGVESGKGIALQKGQGEAFPKGYASELDAHFGRPVPQAASIDMANAPTDAGTNAPLLSLAKPPTRPVTAPAYPLPAVPGATVPSAPQVSVRAPAADNRYYVEPCNDLARPEFGQLCKDKYAQSYADAASRGYVAGYSERFRDAFAQAAGPAHAAAFAVEQATEFNAGRADGARDQGVVDGYTDALPQALADQEAAGRAAWKALQAAGILVRSVSARLVDDDGLFAGGESLALEVVVDNLGGQATAKDGFVVKTKKLEGLEASSTNAVKLPALQGNTRTTLSNVLGLKVKALPTGSRVRFEGSVEKSDGTVVGTIAAEGRVAYPVEIESITVPKGAKLSEKVDVTVKLRNRRAVATKEATLKMSTEDNSLTFGEEPVKVPSIAVGEAVEVVVPMTPSIWVGGNVQTPFQATLTEGDTRFTQAYLSVVPVARNGSLYLYDQTGTPVPSGRLKVAANSFVNVVVKLNNETTAFAQGPFGVKAIKTSDPEITIPSGSSISVAYGAFSPGTSWGTMTFTYFVPAKLKGKTASVQIGAYEGANWLHVLNVQLDVQ